jgi:hypothetical protein
MEILELIGVPYFKKGKGIHIKKKNRGKFTEYCGGEVTQKCIDKAKKSKNPTLRKRATFADNARKWKHADGGQIIPKHQNPAGGLTLIGKDRRKGITERVKAWWNDLPTDYSDGMCATDSNGNPIGECAQYSNHVLRKQGLTAKGDAWTRVPFSGAKVLYTGYDKNIPKEYSDSAYWEYVTGAADRLAKQIDPTKLQDYDIVSLTAQGSGATKTAYDKGKFHGRIHTHTGHIRIGDDGERYVIHNVHGNLQQNKLSDILGGNKPFSVVEIARPIKSK